MLTTTKYTTQNSFLDSSPRSKLPYQPVLSTLWLTSSSATNKLSDLEGAVVGVDATSYLQHMTGAGKVQGPAHEPLLSALGGEPIGWKYHIENELDNWKNNGIKPLFVFDGQSIVGKDETDLRNARAALKKTEAAWKLYSEASTEAVRTFGTAGMTAFLFIFVPRY